jgi:hypothetical protein
MMMMAIIMIMVMTDARHRMLQWCCVPCCMAGTWWRASKIDYQLAWREGGAAAAAAAAEAALLCLPADSRLEQQLRHRRVASLARHEERRRPIVHRPVHTPHRRLDASPHLIVNPQLTRSTDAPLN